MLTITNIMDILAYKGVSNLEVAYEVSILQQRKYKGNRFKTGR